LADIPCVAVARHALTLRSKGQRSKSCGYQMGRTPAYARRPTNATAAEWRVVVGVQVSRDKPSSRRHRVSSSVYVVPRHHHHHQQQQQQQQQSTRYAAVRRVSSDTTATYRRTPDRNTTGETTGSLVAISTAFPFQLCSVYSLCNGIISLEIRNTP